MYYLNMAQKRVMELLGEYGALKQSQLEAMLLQGEWAHTPNLDGYLRQLEGERKIKILHGDDGAYICLPDAKPDGDAGDAFDVLLFFRQRALHHRRGRPPVQVLFYYEAENHVHEAFVLVVRPGAEREISDFADANLSGEFQTVFFLCESDAQFKTISARCKHLCALRVGGKIQFFKGT
jgi:hypothetical protein